jgi:hypothetical protein
LRYLHPFQRFFHSPKRRLELHMKKPSIARNAIAVAVV